MQLIQRVLAIFPAKVFIATSLPQLVRAESGTYSCILIKEKSFEN
jgi:hypothetical protein